MQYTFFSGTLGVLDIAEGKPRFIWYKWLDESKASKGIYGKIVAMQFWRWERKRKWTNTLWNSILLNSNTQENMVTV